MLLLGGGGGGGGGVAFPNALNLEHLEGKINSDLLLNFPTLF